MLHPSRCCEKGIHVTTEVHPGTTKCIWCGLVTFVVVPRNPDASTPQLSAPNPAPSSCCDSLTRQANYPRPTITERRDDVAAEFDERFRTMARAYVANSAALTHWVQQGNKLPSVYR